MSYVTINKTGNCSIQLKGVLSFDTIPGLEHEARSMFSDCEILSVDLSGVTRSDSAGISLLVEWMRSARELDKELRYVNLPSQMLSIVRVCSLEHILPIVRE